MYRMQSIQLQLATHLPAMCSTDSQYTSRTPPYKVYCLPSVRSFFMKKDRYFSNEEDIVRVLYEFSTLAGYTTVQRLLFSL